MDDDLETGLKKLETLARVSSSLIYGVIASFGAIGVASVAVYYGAIVLAVNQQESDLILIATLAAVLLFFGSAIAIGMWIYRAHANLFAAGLDGLEFTPGWSVGWFFVPVMSLFRPFQAMRELWNRSHAPMTAILLPRLRKWASGGVHTSEETSSPISGTVLHCCRAIQA